MKKIAYVLTSHAHKRVYESFVERKDMNQIIIGPVPTITSGIVPEDYSDFKIHNICYFKTESDLQKIINSFAPDIYVQSDLSSVHPIIKKSPIAKTVIIHHGAVGNHAIGVAKTLGPGMKAWRGFDLYCGANHHFENFVKEIGRAKSNQILIDAAAQFDIIYNHDYYDSYRDLVLARTKNPSAEKVILFVGFSGKDRIDFVAQNEDYFKVAIELENLARENNWIILVKPRHTYAAIMNFLKNHSWGSKYIKKYTEIQNSKFLHFVTTTGHIYRYFFADLFVLNGSSTVELEASAINKPLIIVRTKLGSKNGFDPYETILRGAGNEVTKIENLAGCIGDCLNNKKIDIDAQKELIKYHGLTFDGKMHSRIQDRLLNL